MTLPKTSEAMISPLPIFKVTFQLRKSECTLLSTEGVICRLQVTGCKLQVAGYNNDNNNFYSIINNNTQ